MLFLLKSLKNDPQVTQRRGSRVLMQFCLLFYEVAAHS